MGREIRMVPPDWKHPTDYKGEYVPMHKRSLLYHYTEEEIQEEIASGYLNKYMPDYGLSLMPQFPEGTATYYQMYETVTEGTPVSPPMESPEALASWLVDNKHDASYMNYPTYEQWLAMIARGSAPSFIISNGQMMSGVEGMSELDT